MDIVIVSQYLRDIESFKNNNSRFVYLAKMLADNPKNQVEIVTSDFNHGAKKHFRETDNLHGIKVTAVHESGYPKNVCLKRFASHKELAKNISNYLVSRRKPDICYCAVPSLDVADAVASYCQKNDIRFIVDIQDLWPEAFKMVFHVPIISDLIFAPMQKKANRIYSCADEVVAVSQTYADRAMSVNSKCKKPTVVYLGTEKKGFDSYAQSPQNKKVGTTVVYVGSMAASYDLYSVIDAIAKLNDATVKLLAMGDGALKETFMEYAEEKGINAEFTGALPYPKMAERLIQCDIAVNPIHKGSAGSIINKVGDYAMAGLPVINTQESQEYCKLLEQYEAGINCECENSDEIVFALKKLINNPILREQMSNNSRILGEERFDRQNTYRKLVFELLKNGGGGVIRIAYCGTLGHSYDITCVIEAIKALPYEIKDHIVFVVMGGGPKEDEFRNMANGLPIIFTGRLSYPEMVWVLSRCDIAVNPIVKGAAQSIINKHMDYAMAGLPVINTQECLEYRNMIKEYNAGINCNCENIEDITNAISTLCLDEVSRKKMGDGNRKMGVEKFDRRNAYNMIYELITKERMN